MDHDGGRHSSERTWQDAQVLAYSAVERLTHRQRRLRRYLIFYLSNAVLALAALGLGVYSLLVDDSTADWTMRTFVIASTVLATATGVYVGSFAAARSRRQQMHLLRRIVVMEQSVAQHDRARQRGDDHYEQMALQSVTHGGQGSEAQPAADASRAESSGLDGFSVEASRAFFGAITRYVVDLEQLCRFMGKRSRSDVVSESHVTSAEEAMGMSTASKLARHVGSLGGVLLGAGLGNMFAMVNDEKYKTGSVITTFLFALTGVALIMFHVAKDS